MNKEEYYKLLEKHDWYYERSDDPTVHARGRDSFINLIDIATNAAYSGNKDSVEMSNLLKDYVAYMFSGPAFGSPQKPKPIL